MTVKAIKAGKLIDGTGAKPFYRPLLIVEDGRIKAVGRQGETSIPTDAETIDLGDSIILPGLMEAHCHLSRDGEPDFMIPMIRELVTLRALKAYAYARRDLEAGYTTVRTAGDVGYVDIALKQAVTLGLVIGPRILAAGKVLCVTGGHRDGYFAPGMKYEGMAIIVDGPEAVRRASRELIKRGVDWVKLIATGGVVSPTEPDAQQMTYEEMKAACDTAKSLGKRTAAHAHGAKGAKAAIQAGINSIEHGKYLDDEAIRMMVDNGVYYVPTLCATHNVIAFGKEVGVPEFAIEKSKEGHESHLRNFAKAVEAGVKIAAASDAGGTCVYHGQNAKELELMVQAGMDEMAAIQSATQVAAELLGLEDRIGTLEMGKIADLIAVEKDPLQDISALKDVSFVMQGGHIIKQQSSL